MKIIVAFMVLVSVGVASAQSVRVKENIRQYTVLTDLSENVKKVPPSKKKTP